MYLTSMTFWPTLALSFSRKIVAQCATLIVSLLKSTILLG
jgi:hypothetical protein